MADGIIKEKFGPEALWLRLKPLWPEDKPHLGIAEIAEWFASYVYLPKLRDRVTLKLAIRDAVAKLDPNFGYAVRFDAAADSYSGLVFAKAPPEPTPPTAVLVRAEVALQLLRRSQPAGTPASPSAPGPGALSGGEPSAPTTPGTPAAPAQPRRFYGSVEIDMMRPAKSFDAILNAVAMELQRTPAPR